MNRGMKPYLLGAAAAAAVVLAALAGWALLRPQAGPPAPADPTAAPAAARIDAYGRAVQRHVDGMRYVGTQERLPRPRQGYQVTFQTDDERLLKGRDDASNAARQAAWRQRFCTEELRGEMRDGGVSVVSGRVVDGAGRTQYVADCVGEEVKMGPGGPLL